MGPPKWNLPVAISLLLILGGCDRFSAGTAPTSGELTPNTAARLLCDYDQEFCDIVNLTIESVEEFANPSAVVAGLRYEREGGSSQASCELGFRFLRNDDGSFSPDEATDAEFCRGGDGEGNDSISFGQPTVEGDPLPIYAAGTQDLAIGLIAPTITGADWSGNPVSIEPNGIPKIVLFFAHWCPHCQTEVAVVQDWIDVGSLPNNVELISVVTSTDQTRPNWPPQEWLEEEGWTSPVIIDDQVGTVAASFGMSGVPFYVVLDGNNTTLGRLSGEIGTQGLDALVAVAKADSG